MRPAFLRSGAAGFLLLFSAAAFANDCAGRTDVLGTTRTMKVSAGDGPVGLVSYRKTLDLADREVMLTFDDGPMPKRTPAVLEALARECVKATFFAVGSMAAAYPELLRQVADNGHTIGTHTWSHAYLHRRRNGQGAATQISGGLQAANMILDPGQRQQLSPFFRFPGLGHSKALDQFVVDHGLIAMSVDIDSQDWRKISPEDVLRRPLQQLEARGKGIVLMHDIQARTIAILPELLRQLKERGYKVVHIVPDIHEARAAVAGLGAPQTKQFQTAMARAQQKLSIMTAMAKPGEKSVPATQDVFAATLRLETFGLRGSI